MLSRNSSYEASSIFSIISFIFSSSFKVSSISYAVSYAYCPSSVVVSAVTLWLTSSASILSDDLLTSEILSNATSTYVFKTLSTVFASGSVFLTSSSIS